LNAPLIDLSQIPEAADEVTRGAAYRTALKAAKAALHQRFMQDESVLQLVSDQAQVIDQLLTHLWSHQMRDLDECLCLVAVGGYGRGELHPHSDIDLLLISRDEPDRLVQHLEPFLRFLWDIGLVVGHSVRTLEACVSEATADITVATNLMESRLLAGSRTLFEAMKRATDADHIWPGADFFSAKLAEQQARHRRYHDTAYNLEPNIKEGPGGLRDLQMIGWVVKRHYRAETLAALVEHEFLSLAEYQELIDAQTFLWRIRCGLHLFAKRREDRLVFDHQRRLAELFGYRDDGRRLAVEAFMRDYYRTVKRLSLLNDILLQHFQEVILTQAGQSKPVPINRRFRLNHGYVEVIHPRIFKRYPIALLELFLILSQHPEAKGVRANTIRLLRANLHLIDDDFRAGLPQRSLFMELLRQPKGVAHALRRMNRYGILGAYLPAFEPIIGQMQHDLFHVYTVDEHTLRVIENLRRFTQAHHSDEYPLCSHVINHLPKPELIYIAALFHDIAKGRGGDHSELGAADAIQFCRHHGLSEYDTNLVAWLVRNHLMLSTTAQRKDISDPDVINDFSAKMGQRTRLDYLYLLTVADVRATSPAIWNGWKDALFAELYTSATRALRRGLANPVDKDELLSETRNDALALLSEEGGVDLPKVPPLWGRFNDDYFLYYSPEEIAWQTRAILRHGDRLDPLILIREEGWRGGTEIFIFTPVCHHHFATTTALLDQLGLDVLDARVMPSKDGFTLDCYIVLDTNQQPIREPFQLDQIERTLSERLVCTAPTQSDVVRRTPRQQKHFSVNTRVGFQQLEARGRTIVEVVTSDRPGVLSKIAQGLVQCGLRVHTAKIATFGERVEDLFFVSDERNHPITDPLKLAEIDATLTRQLSA